MSFPNCVNTHVYLFSGFVDFLGSVSFFWRIFIHSSGKLCKLLIYKREARACGSVYITILWVFVGVNISFMKKLWLFGAPRSTLTLPFCHISRHLYNRIIFHKSLKCNAIVLKCYGDMHKALNKTSSKFNSEKWRTRQRFSRLQIRVFYHWLYWSLCCHTLFYNKKKLILIYLMSMEITTFHICYYEIVWFWCFGSLFFSDVGKIRNTACMRNFGQPP